MQKSNFWEKYKILICAVGLFVFFAAVVVLADQIQILVKSTSVDARFWPRLIGYVGCGFSVILFIQSFLELNQNEKTGDIEGKTLEERKEKSDENKRAMISLLLIFLYILGLQYIGFFISTIAYLTFQFTISAGEESRNFKKFFLLALIFSVCVYVIFRYMFRLMLPTGSLWNYL